MDFSFASGGSGTATAGLAGTVCPSPNPGDPIDHIAASGSHTFTASDAASSYRVSVQLCDDVVGEPDETVDLEWSASPAGFGPGSAQGTIEDDEPKLSVSDASACEAATPSDCGDPDIGGGRLTFTVQRLVPKPPGQTPAVTVRYRTRPGNPNDAVSHLALPSVDYAPVPGDDCGAESPRIQIPAGAAGQATVTPVGGTPITITAVSNTPPEGTITTVQVDVRLIDDRLDEHGDEILWLQLCDPSDSAWIDDEWARGTIADDDPPPTLTTPDAGPATEGGQLPFTVTLDTPSGRDVSVDYWTEDGSATATDNDYTAVPQTPRTTLTFPVDAATGATDASMMTRTATIGVLADSLYEPDTDPDTPSPHTETVALRLHPSNAVAAAAPAPCPNEAADDALTPEDEAARSRQDDRAVGTITDADTPPELTVAGDCTLSGAPASATGCVAEGATLAFTLALDKTSSQPVEVIWAVVSVSGGAVPDDFEPPPSGTETIMAGFSVATIVVPTFDDAFDEEDFETFTLRLSVSDGATVAAGHDRSIGAIADNDDMPRVGFVGSPRHREGGALAFTVALLGSDSTETPSGWTVTVQYYTSGAPPPAAAPAATTLPPTMWPLPDRRLAPSSSIPPTPIPPPRRWRSPPATTVSTRTTMPPTATTRRWS